MSDYKFSPPMRIDVIPPRKDEEVKGSGLIGWKVYTEVGAPVHLTVEDIKNDVRVRALDALKPGMELIVPTLFGYVRAVVRDSGMAETKNAIYPLKYCEKRECWVCDSCIMRSCIDLIAKMEMK